MAKVEIKSSPTYLLTMSLEEASHLATLMKTIIKLSHEADVIAEEISLALQNAGVISRF